MADSPVNLPEQGPDSCGKRIGPPLLTGPAQICDSFFFNQCKFAASFILTKAAYY